MRGAHQRRTPQVLGGACSHTQLRFGQHLQGPERAITQPQGGSTASEEDKAKKGKRVRPSSIKQEFQAH